MKGVKILSCTFVFLLFSASTARAQAGEISGTVTDTSTGETLPGVNVVIEGTAQGAATDAEGRYTIPNVEPGTYTLVATFVGYTDEVVEGVEVTDGETTVVDVALQPEALGLEEVVVVGYGTRQEENLTGSVTSVSGAELAEQPVVQTSAALMGKAAGVTVIQDSGQPGGKRRHHSHQRHRNAGRGWQK